MCGGFFFFTCVHVIVVFSACLFIKACLLILPAPVLFGTCCIHAIQQYLCEVVSLSGFTREDKEWKKHFPELILSIWVQIRNNQ